MSSDSHSNDAASAFLDLDSSAIDAIWEAAKSALDTREKNAAALLRAFVSASGQDFEKLVSLKEQVDAIRLKRENLAPVAERTSDQDVDEELTRLRKRSEKERDQLSRNNADQELINESYDDEGQRKEEIILDSSWADEWLNEEEDRLQTDIEKLFKGIWERKVR